MQAHFQDAYLMETSATREVSKQASNIKLISSTYDLHPIIYFGFLLLGRTLSELLFSFLPSCNLFSTTSLKNHTKNSQP